MWDFLTEIAQQYGLPGVILIVLLGCIIYQLRYVKKHNYQESIDNLGDKIDVIDEKVDNVDRKFDKRINIIEKDIQSTRQQTINVMTTGVGGQLSQALRNACDVIGCDHIFLGSFHNGTADLRGLHYCRFDILIDEFKDPLHLRKNDTDFQPLYKDENVMAYGNFPYMATKANSCKFDLDNDELFKLSDTLYRRCKGRDIKQIAFAIIRDKGNNPIGFVGCVSYIKHDINLIALEQCAGTIENIYSNQKCIQD